MQEAPVKIVVSGPVGAGKSTYIRRLSEVEAVDTDVRASEQIGKENTTVAMDYGLLHLDGVPVHLFGTPGQTRFDFMWEVLCEGAMGLLLLVSGHRPQDFVRARHILEFVTSRVPLPFVVGVTHQDQPRVWAPDEVAEFFGLPESQVVGVDANESASCVRLLARLLELALGTPTDGAEAPGTRP